VRAAGRAVAASRPFDAIAAVVLPDHMHFLWRPPGDKRDFPTRVAQ